MRLAAGLACLTMSTPAAAHAADAWNWDPLVVVPLLVVLALYLRSFGRLARRQSVAFAAGLIVLIAALVSPLNSVAEESLSAHMAQHALLIALAPPLLLFGNPAQIFAWGGARFSLRLAWIFAVLSRPAPAALLHGLALWLW